MSVVNEVLPWRLLAPRAIKSRRWTRFVINGSFGAKSRFKKSSADHPQKGLLPIASPAFAIIPSVVPLFWLQGFGLLKEHDLPGLKCNLQRSPEASPLQVVKKRDGALIGGAHWIAAFRPASIRRCNSDGSTITLRPSL